MAIMAKDLVYKTMLITTTSIKSSLSSINLATITTTINPRTELKTTLKVKELS